ncbi:MAG TPA: DUF433 domain-containing protein [Candidatus Lokiarchaeia archaeon]|nr:DUF433 domain-containing protein [Candidatus Lokiarchaeia archaeon]
MDLDERISINPDICHGKPVIRNTRIPVELVLGLIEDGADVKEILDMYPHITRDDIKACVRYARKAIEDLSCLR